MLNTSEKSLFTIATSKMSWSAMAAANASNLGMPVMPANVNVDNTTSLLLDGVYFEPTRNHKLQYYDREKGVLFKWIQVRRYG